jgi:transposase
MYATDLTDAQWQCTKSSLDYVGRKRKHDLRVIINALLYLVKTGCQWRKPPSDFPKWQLVYYYYRKWGSDGTLDLLLDSLRSKARVRKDQGATPTMGIIDSQSVRGANNRTVKGIDGNKKVKGRKRHIVADKNGWLISVLVTVANLHDSKAAEMLAKNLNQVLVGIKLLIADGGYRGELADRIKKQFGYILKVIMRAEEKSNVFTPLPVRCVVERTFSWLDNDRRLCRDYELLSDSAEAMVKLPAIKLLLNKF